MILALNKRANFDYHIVETFEAGLELTGPEVKSARKGEVSLKEAYIIVGPKGARLVGAHFANYKKAANVSQDPLRDRRLLLKKEELNRLMGQKTSGGLTIVPIKLYTKKHRIKLEIGLARGRKKADKRELIKKRDIDREIRRGNE